MKKVTVNTCVCIYQYRKYEIEVPDTYPDKITQEFVSSLDNEHQGKFWRQIYFGDGYVKDEEVAEEWIVD